MNKNAYFFQGDILLLPINADNSQLVKGVPLELADDFKTPDVFEIPPLTLASEFVSTGRLASALNVVSVLPQTALPANWKAVPVRQVLAVLSTEPLAADGCLERIMRACHIAQWRLDSRFCGRCGAENYDDMPQRICPKCARIEFPRICPAVIVIITDDEERILLAHNKKFRSGVYSLISGFNEAGESLEETAAREIREEVNIEVRDIRYIKSQSWPFPNSLMLGFRARYSSGTIKPDGIEIEDAKWFSRDNLPELPGEGSLSRYLISCWLNRKL